MRFHWAPQIQPVHPAIQTTAHPLVFVPGFSVKVYSPLKNVVTINALHGLRILIIIIWIEQQTWRMIQQISVPQYGLQWNHTIFHICPQIGYAVHSVQLIVAFQISRWSSDQGAKRYTKWALTTMGREPLAVRSVPFIDSIWERNCLIETPTLRGIIAK